MVLSQLEPHEASNPGSKHLKSEKRLSVNSQKLMGSLPGPSVAGVS